MFKKILPIVVGLGLASRAWAGFGQPYIGEEEYGWATTNAVTVTAGCSQPPGSPPLTQMTNQMLLNGGEFEASTNWGSKLPYPGATNATDGIHHTYNMYFGWMGHTMYTNGIPHPSGRDVGPLGDYRQDWLSFTFDKPYTVTDFDIWNGSSDGPPGSYGDYCFMDTYIDYKLGDGTWLMASNTMRLSRDPTNFVWFAPTDTIPVNLSNVVQVVLTPTNSWHDNCTWNSKPFPDPCTTAAVTATMNEIRFYRPLPSLSVVNQGGNVTVSWPADIFGFSLESSAVLGTGASWGPVGGVVNNSVTIASPAGTQFYRLKK